MFGKLISEEVIVQSNQRGQVSLVSFLRKRTRFLHGGASLIQRVEATGDRLHPALIPRVKTTNKPRGHSLSENDRKQLNHGDLAFLKLTASNDGEKSMSPCGHNGEKSMSPCGHIAIDRRQSRPPHRAHDTLLRRPPSTASLCR
jgi:hypothetical protein